MSGAKKITAVCHVGKRLAGALKYKIADYSSGQEVGLEGGGNAMCKQGLKCTSQLSQIQIHKHKYTNTQIHNQARGGIRGRGECNVQAGPKMRCFTTAPELNQCIEGERIC